MAESSWNKLTGSITLGTEGSKNNLWQIFLTGDESPEGVGSVGQKAVYLGTTTTHLHYDPPIGIDVGTVTTNLATLFYVEDTGEKNPFGYTLWKIRNYVTPKVSVRVQERPHSVGIFMNAGDNSDTQKFYFRGDFDPSGTEGQFLDICFDAFGSQYRWAPEKVLDDQAPHQTLIIGQLLEQTPEQPLFNLVPVQEKLESRLCGPATFSFEFTKL